MSEFLFMRMGNSLIPACEEATDWLRRKKLGATILVEPREPRNGAFHRKYFALLDLAYEYWNDTTKHLEYKGQQVAPDRERFRKDIQILAGFCQPVVNIKNEVRLEAESISWASMTEERFGQLFDAVIKVLLDKVFIGPACEHWTESELRRVAEDVEAFAA